jgi:hypothetical protein
MRGKSVHYVDRLSGASFQATSTHGKFVLGQSLVSDLIPLTEDYENPPYILFYLPHLQLSFHQLLLAF